MATMIPQRIPNTVLADPKRAAEVRLFESLRKELPDEYVVLYRGRNPATGATIKIPAKTVVKMRVAKAAKEAIVPPKK